MVSTYAPKDPALWDRLTIQEMEAEDQYRQALYNADNPQTRDANKKTFEAALAKVTADERAFAVKEAAMQKAFAEKQAKETAHTKLLAEEGTLKTNIPDLTTAQTVAGGEFTTAQAAWKAADTALKAAEAKAKRSKKTVIDTSAEKAALADATTARDAAKAKQDTANTALKDAQDKLLQVQKDLPGAEKEFKTAEAAFTPIADEAQKAQTDLQQFAATVLIPARNAYAPFREREVNAHNAAHLLQEKKDGEAKIEAAGIAIKQNLTNYLSRPNLYEKMKDQLSDIKDASPAGTSLRPATSDENSEAKMANELAEQIDAFESAYRDNIPANARAVWARRFERRAFYANIASQVRENHKDHAQSYAELTKEIKHKRSWLGAREEVMAQIREQRDIHRAEYEGNFHTKSFLGRLKARVTFQYAREWVKNRFQEDRFRRIVETREHYKEKMKMVKKEEEVSAKARANLRKKLDKATRHALRK